MDRTVDAGSLQDDLGRFRRIADALPHLAWFSDPAGRIEFVNEPWVAYTGLSLDMLQDDGVKGVVHPEERQRTLDAWAAAVAGGRTYEIEYRLRRNADDSYRWFLARAQPVREPDGRILGWIGTATDIDDRKRAHEMLEFVFEAEASFSGTHDVPTICRSFAAVAIKGFADWCFLQLVSSPETLVMVAAAHRDAGRREEVERFIARAPRRPRAGFLERLQRGSILAPTITAEQLEAEAADADHLAILRSLQMHSVIVVPMRAADGALLGAISFIAAESLRTFSEADLAVAKRIADRAANALESAQRFEGRRRLADRLQLVDDAMQHAYDDRTVDVGEMAQRIARAGVPVLADRVAIFLREGGDRPRLLAVHDVDERMIENAFVLRDAFPLSSNSLISAVLATNRTALVKEVDEATLRSFSDDEGYLEGVRRIGMRSLLVVPLRGAGGAMGALVLSMCRDSVRRFSDEDIPVAEELAARAAFALDLALRHERERRISQTFQRAALPAELPKIPGTTLSAWYEAGGSDAQIGGDWYDAFRLPDGRLVLSIGDVAGSGLDAAVIMGSVRQSIRTAAIINPEPRLVLDAVDRVVRALGERFVTAFAAIFDPLFGELRYASAGHPAALLRTPSGRVEALVTRGLPLGLRNVAESETSSRTLTPGSQLLLYTDGLSEVDHDVIAGERRLSEAFAAGAVSARGLFTRAMAGRHAHDDAALMLLAFEHSPLRSAGPNGAARWQFATANANAGTAVRRDLRRFLGEHGVTGHELDQAEIVAGELIGNVVRYAPGNVEIVIDASTPLPVLHVIDQGPGFELNPRLPADVMAESGRGLFIITALVEELTISRRTDGAGSHARVVLRRSGTH